MEYKRMNKVGAGLRPFLINIVLVIVFSVFIVYFALGFIVIKNPDSQILTQSNLNGTLSELNSSINNFSNTAQNVYSQAGDKSNQPSATDYLFLIFKGAFYIPLAFLGFAFASIFSISNLIFLSFGGGLFGGVITIMLGVVTSTLIITLVFYFIKTVRSGESDR